MGFDAPTNGRRARRRRGSATRTPTTHWVVTALVAVGQLAALVGTILRSCS
jgi:hypothetical protein